MQFNIEKKISNFVESQFPQFYLDEGPNFVLFVKAYYEWMESEGQVINQSRSLFDIRDIDNTLTDFLEHFQSKYLYGIPFNVIVNKRELLKHILDVYRSKGSTQCYKLLFRLIYDQDAEIYLPGTDILKPSDGTWLEPKYLEVTNVSGLNSFVGKTIYGTTSGASAVVEDYVTEPVSQNIVALLYISNLSPKGGTFDVGEKVVILGQQSNTAAVIAAPTVKGSLESIQIINGGQSFNVGDIIKVVNRDISNNQLISDGIEGLLRVTSLSRGLGSLTFNINSGGFGYNLGAKTFLYSGNGDVTGTGASFSLESFSYVQTLTYNTDIIVDYANTVINAASYSLPGNTGANSASALNTVLRFASNTFGTIASLTNIETGNGYTQSPSIFVRNFQDTLINLAGNVSYSNTSNTIVGTGTAFQYFFSNGDGIYLKANTSASSIEYQIIKTVDSNTSITLYAPPTYIGNGASSATFRTAPVILPSQFALYDTPMQRTDSTINGQNESIIALPSQGNNIVASAVAYNSGKGYSPSSTVKAYLFSALNTPSILNGGSGYSNNDVLIFSGGLTNSPASGYVTTNGSGVITAVVLSYAGSAYQSVPVISVKSTNGFGAVFTTTIKDLNTTSSVTGKVVKAGVGKKPGYWSTSRGFTNYDKYIQDSYFYQDFSYQIKVANVLDKYKNILYDTFHTSGAELFGQYLKLINESALTSIISESKTINPSVYLVSDMTIITSDKSTLTVDKITI